MASSGAEEDGPEAGAAPNVEVSSVGSRAVRPADVDDTPRALAGKTIGRYRLLYPVAAGGMAQVWTAKPEGGGLARTVAIKLVRPEYAADEEYSRMFIDEAMVASSIHHPNVCEIYELGRDGDLLFMVLEWVAGDSLSGLVQRGAELSPLPDHVAARIVADACAGLHAAHEAIGQDGQPLGIVHRDVSPPNILVSMHGHVKVSDFGIAKARHQLHSRTRTGEIKGKFAYIPPEQILGRGVDRRADIYAMGCVLYVASLGLRPFGGGASALGKIVQGKFRLPSELRADYPEELQAIVVKSLAADPNQRYQTAEEMRLALEQWMLTSSKLATPSDVARIVRERMNPERRRLVEAVMSQGRSLPEALAYQLLSISDKTDTPTATSGLVVQPDGLGKKGKAKSKARPEQDSVSDTDATLVASITTEQSRSGTLKGLGGQQPSATRSERPAVVTARQRQDDAVTSRPPSRRDSGVPQPRISKHPSSAPPEFRGGVSQWVFWMLGLAVVLLVLAFALGKH
ncbi:MAG TPA: serine/threonine-protein kinase [Polyangiaceae bacterium]|nr:serine/threonine-protein kinase [Polyangiaceae bacterium]